MIKSGQVWAGLFNTVDATGALAAGTPAGVLYVDGVANAAVVTITGANPYKFSVTLPALTAGQRVDMYITATIATIATASVVASEQADTSLLSDGVVVNSGTITTLTNLPAITTDWLTAAGVKADAVTKIQAGIPANVWANSDRTLTQSATSIISAVTGSSISDVRGSSWSIEITDLTLDANKQQFMIKRNDKEPDSTALLLVDSETGLLTLNGVSSGLTAADATLVYAGTTLTLTVKASVTAQLPEGTLRYGVQYVTAAGLVEEPYGGNFTITADVVRLTA